MTNDESKHLANRAGFGRIFLFSPGVSRAEAVDLLLPGVPASGFQLTTAEEWGSSRRKVLLEGGMSREEAQTRIRSFREKTSDLVLSWMEEMRTTAHPLREKMALFWHGHFATRVGNPYFEQLLLNELREKGLGSFSTLLTAVAQSPAMLQFLNNQQNRKAHPNENFARELMELFTLGRGQYTEQDVKESARAFTGWSYDEAGHFSGRPRQHDEGAKTILGSTGNFDGNDVIRIILQKKACAHFITARIYRYFVNEEALPAQRIDKLAADFYDSGYDLSRLMRSIFMSDWFYSPENRAARVKSPVELLVGIQQFVPVTFDQPRTPVRLQRVLGQHLFNPPNVAGWPGGRDWIDSSSLIIRMRLPEALFASKELDLRAKEQDAEMGDPDKRPVMQDRAPEGRFRVGKVLSADWQGLYARFSDIADKDLPRALAGALLPLPVFDETLRTVSRFSDSDSRQERIRSLTIRLMGLPEFQLC